MPPPAAGGPWPSEWLDLLRRWKESGFKRLELGSGTVTRSQSGSKMIVAATGTFPAAGYRGWLQLEGDTETARTYHLYFEGPDVPEAGEPDPSRCGNAMQPQTRAKCSSGMPQDFER